MPRIIQIGSSFLLLAAFLTFNVGVPVAYYLCPMMTADNPMCDMSVSTSDTGHGITSQTPSCCTKVLGPERNTAPFLKGNHSSDIEHSLVQVLILDTTAPELSASLATLSCDSSPGKPSSEPLFILNSSLLI